jgi:hypothetical protein
LRERTITGVMSSRNGCSDVALPRRATVSASRSSDRGESEMLTTGVRMFLIVIVGLTLLAIAFMLAVS